jgi:transcriptional regulator of arginine metabolism
MIMLYESKNSRHFAIRQILGNQPIGSQDKLRKELKKQGYNVTQATLSRDLKEMNVSRSSSIKGTKYIAGQPEAIQSLKSLIGEEVISIIANEYVIVVNTLPGCGSVIGEFIDTKKNKDIIGTIAGDNTLLVVPSSVKKTKLIMKYLIEILIKGRQ